MNRNQSHDQRYNIEKPATVARTESKRSKMSETYFTETSL